jgi:hypothetical protein
MRSAARAVVCLLATLALGAALPPVATGADPCDGLGGTGLTSSGMEGTGIDGGGGDDGIGGTGHSDDGLGGTGLGDEDDGLGGTGLVAGDSVGVLGTITGFGSICVNGQRVAYGSDVQVDVDGQPATAKALAIGHVVAVDARIGDGGLRAARISVRRAAVGPVTGVNAGRGRLHVMGQSVSVRGTRVYHDAATGREVPLDRLEPGRRVAVSGLYRSDGVLVASRLDALAAGPRASLTGPVHRVSERRLYVGDVPVEAPSAPPNFVDLRGTVHATGEWDADRESFVLDRIESGRPFAARVRRAFVEGYLREREGARFRVSGVPVDATRVAEQLPRTGELVRVVVSGPVDDGGVLEAERVEIAPDGRNRGKRVGDAEDREDRGDRDDREDREDRADREDRSGRSERAERAERPERVERPERPERADRSGRN